jgi:hypothetical protein
MRVLTYGILFILSITTSFGITAELGRIVIPATSSAQTASTVYKSSVVGTDYLTSQ